MLQAYKVAIAYFLAFSILLLLSSILIFEEKIGFSVEEVLRYYLGDEEKFISAKTYTGYLKIIVPHIFAFGLFSMVILHFVVFTSIREKKWTLFIIYLTFFMLFMEISSSFFIIAGFESFAYVKIFSFVVFELLIVYILFILFLSIVYE